MCESVCMCVERGVSVRCGGNCGYSVCELLYFYNVSVGYVFVCVCVCNYEIDVYYLWCLLSCVCILRVTCVCV